ncbi:MAG: acetyl esterase/lipase, partial [Cryomorphaceae bacterium]
MKQTKYSVFAVLLALCSLAWAQDNERNFFAAMQQKLQPSQVVTYKTIGTRGLTLHIFHPVGFKPTQKRPAHVVIHGGGWRGGTPRRFYPY